MGSRVGKTNEADRRAWLERALLEVPAGCRLLDAGAGEQQYRPLCEHLEYVSQDFGEYVGDGDERGLQTGTWDTSRVDIVSDITAIPVDDASFDAVLCSEVLEHVPHPVAVLVELTRVLRPGGTLIVTAPFCSMTHFSPYFFSTGFGARFYEYWLDQLGYRIEDLHLNGNYFEFQAQELRRIDDMAKRYAGSRLGWLARRAVRFLLRRMARFSARDTGSNEFLAYGVFVRAVRTREDLGPHGS